MLDCWRECQMSTLCTAFPSFPREGDTPLNILKNCAKTTAKINMQKTIPIDELRPSWKSHLEFYAFSSRPPTGLAISSRGLTLFAPRHSMADDSAGAGGGGITDAAYNWRYKCSYTASIA
jgi:hypothetical protein